MTAKQRWLTGLVLGFGVALVLPAAATAEDPKPDKKDVEKKKEVADIGRYAIQGAELAEFGHKEKSPAALVAAAECYLKAEGLGGKKLGEINEEVKAVDQDGKPVEVKKEKTRSYKEEAEDLFDEARSLAKDLPDGTVEALIKAAKARKFNARDLLDGPRTMSRVIRPGEVHEYDFLYLRQLPAYFGWHNNGQAPLYCTVSAGEFVRLDTYNNNANLNFVPGFSRTHKVEKNHVRIENVGRKATVYTIILN
jgi:hypothetical protein